MAKLTHEEILAYLEEATILELNDLVKAIEEKFDVTAAAHICCSCWWRCRCCKCCPCKRNCNIN